MYRIGLLVLLSLLIGQCTTDFRSGNYGVYTDNLESLKEKDNKITGRDDKFRVGDLPQVQRDTTRSGKIALRLNPEFPYGLNYPLPNVRTDEYVEASIWYTGPGQVVLVASHKDAKYFYRKSLSTESDGKDWKELRLSVSVPPNMNKKDLNIYLWNPGQLPVYVDDFKVTYQKFKSYPSFKTDENLHLLIDTVDMIRLEQKRDEAFANGILETEDEDFVSGILYYKDSIMPIDIRLKGDWLDHLESRKWSFRIKMKKQNTWKNLRSFSIHTPLARDFLNEYVAHKLYRESDLLAPRYGFVPVTLNGTSLGIYAWEEHFEKQLIEAMNRREGPILKFEEGSFWLSQKVFKQDTQYFELPFLESADIIPFKLNRTLGDATLKNSFLIGQNLMYQYRLGLRQVSEIFNLEKLAGYYAMMDLTRGFHGIAWHNQRYYYNPVLCRLEPIFFDAYTAAGVFNPEKNAISGMFTFDPNAEKRFENLFGVKMFQDTLFLEEYIRCLDEITDPVWINNFLQEEEEQIRGFEKLIQVEFRDYHYDRGFLLENARKIRLELPYYKEMVSANPDYADFDPDKIRYLNYTKRYDPRFPEFYVNAYLQDSSENEYHIKLDNVYPLDIELLGYGTSKRLMENSFEVPQTVSGLDIVLPVSAQLDIPIGKNYIFFKVQGFNERFAIMVMNYPAASDFTPEQELFASAGIPDLSFVTSEGNEIVFNPGQHIIKKPIIIPAGFLVRFNPGCKLDFTSGSFFISRSPVKMDGTQQDPVIILSSDKSSNGFTVLQAEVTCILKNVKFEGLNTLNYKGWTLTGAVNFYESNVEIDAVDFSSNVCEDALNIIRSEFSVINSSFTSTFADAFDSDFCKGIVRNVSFENIGNDAIDFSGSIVKITDCKIINPGDKGVSAGEGSNLTVLNTMVSGANIGYASKDNSILILENCNVADANYGLAAYQKKPEYGPGNIKTNGFKAQGVNTLYLIEKFSKLSLNGTIVTGEATKVADLFY